MELHTRTSEFFAHQPTHLVVRFMAGVTDSRYVRTRLDGHPRPAVFGAVTVAVMLLASGFTLGLDGVTPRGGSNSSLDHAWEEVTAASASLQRGDGPAAGAPESCTVTTSTGYSCSTAASTPTVFPTSATWSNITTKVVPAPSARQTVMVWDAADGYALLFGGYIKVSGVQQYYGESDTWTYMNGVWTNVTSTVIGGAPPDAANPSMAYDPFSQEVVLFGGASNVQGYDQAQTWTYHAGEWTNITNTAGTPPFPRAAAVLVADLADQQMVLFGGLSQNATRERIYAQTDTWLFKDNAWNNITGQVSGSPPALIYAVGAYDPEESGIVVLGTEFPGPPYVSSTYLYSAGKWTNLTASLPTPGPLQVVGLFAYDPSVGAAILSSSVEIEADGPNYAVSPITWAFYDGNWINITTTAGAPPSGTLAGWALLPDGSIFAFGGTTDAVNNTDYSYAFSLPPTISGFAVTPTVVFEGAPVVATASFSDGISPFFQNISWGDGTYSQGNLTAAHTYSTSGNFTLTYSLRDFEGRSVTRTANLTVLVKPSNSPPEFSWTSGTGLYILIAFIVVIVAAVAVLLLVRSRRKPTTAAAPVSPSAAPSGPPSGALGPGPPPPS
jgi:hypothetical protein